jgi:hypothetical protein
MLTKRWMRSLCLSLLVCTLVIGLTVPSFSHSVPSAVPGFMASQSASPGAISHHLAQAPTAADRPTAALNNLLRANLLRNLQSPSSTSASPAPALTQMQMTQGMSTLGMTSYVAILSRHDVVPTPPMTNASGAAGAVLVGDRLVIRSSFRNLSSPLRDYATDPVDPPNPNITSAVHIHQGNPDENGPFQYALEVTLDETGRGGSAQGEYRLTSEQIQALNAGQLYVDLHTTRNRGGELRGILMPY